MEAGSLAGQVAVVTGGGCGMAEAIARKLASLGARVALVGPDGQPSGDPELEAQAGEGRGAVVRFAAGRPDAAAVQALAKAILQTFGNIHILVNHAPLGEPAPVLDLTEGAWGEALDAGLTGAYRWVKAFQRVLLRQASGRIVNVSGVAGLMGSAGAASQAAARAGLIGLTKSLAREFASLNVTVNAVAPGVIDGSRETGRLPTPVREAVLTAVPLGRAGTVEDVAEAVAFLAGPGAGYVTGQVLAVDGGMAM